MKVTFNKSTTAKVLKRIEAMPGNVVLRSDIEDLDTPRQISRAIKRLIDKGILAKLGYGTYAKLAYSEIAKTTYLKNGVLPTFREALTRLNVKWEPSLAEKAYQEGRSTQIPANPDTCLKSRCRRQLSYQGMELKFA